MKSNDTNMHLPTYANKMIRIQAHINGDINFCKICFISIKLKIIRIFSQVPFQYNKFFVFAF
jgi:hypothetical protein